MGHIIEYSGSTVEEQLRTLRDSVQRAFNIIEADGIKAGAVLDANKFKIVNLNLSTLAGGEIDGAIITIRNINADNITSGKIDAAIVRVINIDADNITSGNIDASHVRVTNLDADNIVSGQVAAQRMLANVIQAINLSTSTAVIDAAHIGDLDATKINSGILDASMIDVTNLDASQITTGWLSTERLVLTGNDKDVYPEVGKLTEEEFNVNPEAFYIKNGDEYIQCHAGDWDADTIYYVHQEVRSIIEAINRANSGPQVIVSKDKLIAASIDVAELSALSADLGIITAGMIINNTEWDDSSCKIDFTRGMMQFADNALFENASAGIYWDGVNLGIKTNRIMLQGRDVVTESATIGEPAVDENGNPISIFVDADGNEHETFIDPEYNPPEGYTNRYYGADGIRVYLTEIEADGTTPVYTGGILGNLSEAQSKADTAYAFATNAYNALPGITEQITSNEANISELNEAINNEDTGLARRVDANEAGIEALQFVNTYKGYVDIDVVNAVLTLGRVSVSEDIKLVLSPTVIAFRIGEKQFTYITPGGVHSDTAEITNYLPRAFVLENGEVKSVGSLGWVARHNGHLSLKKVEG